MAPIVAQHHAAEERGGAGAGGPGPGSAGWEHGREGDTNGCPAINRELLGSCRKRPRKEEWADSLLNRSRRTEMYLVHVSGGSALAG